MLSITNNSEDRARLRFRLSYDLSAFASVADPDAEYGTGRSFLGIESTTFGVLFQVFAEADSVFGPPAHAIADSIRVVLNVRPGATETIFLVADSEASAASVAAVPLPPALPGLLAALGALFAVARRRSPFGRQETRTQTCSRSMRMIQRSGVARRKRPGSTGAQRNVALSTMSNAVAQVLPAIGYASRTTPIPSGTSKGSDCRGPMSGGTLFVRGLACARG
jgi:hypothetical protein